MRENFERALKHILRHEGRYVDHPWDPGGATNYGITIGTLSEHLRRRASKAEVRNISMDTVRAIYRKRYWNRIRGDDLPSGVDLCVFDLAVNSGVSRAAKMLQAAVKVPQDGAIGPATLAAVNARTPKVLINSITVDRLSFLIRLRTWKVFGRGWKRRVLEVEREAQKWAAERQLAPTRTQVAEAEEPAHESPQATQTAFYSEPLKQESTMPLKGWKMFLFNAVVAVFGVAEAASWSDFVPEPYDGWIITAIGGINLLLRAYTTTPIFQRTK